MTFIDISAFIDLWNDSKCICIFALEVSQYHDIHNNRVIKVFFTDIMIITHMIISSEHLAHVRLLSMVVFSRVIE